MKNFEKTLSNTALITIFAFLMLLAPAALGQRTASNRTAADIFAILPDGSTGPEGLTVGADGNVYVATFGFNASGAVSASGQLFVFNPEGHLIRQVSIAGSSPHLLGLAFHPTTGALLVIDFGAGQVLNVNPVTGTSSVFMTVTGSSGLNALTFDQAGNVYVSDSFQGIIWKTGPTGGAGSVWVQDPLLTTTGVPPFGANGVEFNHAQTIMFVANTGNDTIVQIPVTNGTPGQPTVLVNSINGADGIAVDGNDNLWVAANQSDEIVVVSPTGKLIARLGDFEGVDNTGLPHGLLFPASPAFSTNGEFLYVTNLALDLRLATGNPASQTLDSQWCDQVRHYTVSRVRTHFRPLQ
ncbi:MAG TPA: SMP-30/gluconolactonase/LRE family protein [Candidatus Angelobacter sp.]